MTTKCIARATPRRRVESVVVEPPEPTPVAWQHGARWLRGRLPSLLAVIAHGALVRGERVLQAPLELLAVVRSPPTPPVEALQSEISPLLGGPRVELALLEAHGLGWLRPSILQQSLRAGAVLLWGDPAALAVVPDWPPGRLDPRLALDEQAGAERDLAAGRLGLAVYRSAGALLIARRRYEPWFHRRLAALHEVWLEVPPLPPNPEQAPATHFVTNAGVALHDWLFTWEGAGPGLRAIGRYETMWRASRAAAAP